MRGYRAINARQVADDARSARKLTPDQAMGLYDFADLAGIIFGVRTHEKEKIEIMRVIEAECRASSRKDFEFHQARYAPGGELRIVPQTLLKFDFERTTAS